MMIYVGISLAVSTVGLHFTISLPISFGRLKMHDRKMVHNNEQRIEKNEEPKRTMVWKAVPENERQSYTCQTGKMLDQLVLLYVMCLSSPTVAAAWTTAAVSYISGPTPSAIELQARDLRNGWLACWCLTALSAQTGYVVP